MANSCRLTQLPTPCSATVSVLVVGGATISHTLFPLCAGEGSEDFGEGDSDGELGEAEEDSDQDEAESEDDVDDEDLEEQQHAAKVRQG